jgi:hypothetical protein
VLTFLPDRARTFPKPSAFFGSIIESNLVILAAADDRCIGNALLFAGNLEHAAIGINVLAAPAVGRGEAIEEWLNVEYL